jgi:prepilin-type N-terminal cleavage/methylation domain-containing protein
MINFLKNSKIYKLNKGMTLLELMVVLGIFGVLSLVAVFNYGDFQSRVDITNLANDIALQVVQAQKSALNGLWPTQSHGAAWKPSYGVYFSKTTDPATDNAAGANNKNFIYFVNLNNSTNLFDGNSCPPPPPLPSSTNECLNKYTITKNNSISNISAVYTTGNSPTTLNDLTITFTRPNSVGILKSTTAFTPGFTVSYVEITIINAKGNTPSTIDLYPSGRVQIN